MESKYLVAEKFKSIQGEGVYAGTPMAFIRFVGCSVGKTVCHHCDTDFATTYPWFGGGEFTEAELLHWALPYEHFCFTGGEPFDQPGMAELISHFRIYGTVHVETSGTVPIPETLYDVWITICPKPGWIPQNISRANEIKVIVPGLGNGPGWPTLENALEWAKSVPVFLQPRNKKHEIDYANLALCEELVRQHPSLRLSPQLHKILRVR